MSVKAAEIGEYEPTGSEVDVWQLVAGRVAVHRLGCPDELNTTVPVAEAGRPDSARVAAVPWGMVADEPPFTVIVKDVVATMAALIDPVVAGGLTVTWLAEDWSALLLNHCVT